MSDAALLDVDAFRRDAGLADFRLPHLDQYFGVWAIEPERFQAAVHHAETVDLVKHVRAQIELGEATEEAAAGRARGKVYPVAGDGVAVIELSGPLTKYVASMAAGTSTVFLRRQIRLAAADDDVRAILLVIDSPGGTVAGTPDLAAEVAAAARQKPLDAYIEDLGASAAYWIASQARHVWSNSNGLVGAMGTYGVIVDYSARAAAMGLKVHVVKAGEFKGAGVPGTEITQKQLDVVQSRVNQLNEFFLEAVAAGRRLSLDQVRELADGRVHIGAEAQKLGLTDGVRTLDQVLAQLSSKPKSIRGTAVMSKDTEQLELTAVATELRSGAADVATIQRLCPEASDSFVLGQLKAGHTEDQVRQAWQAELAAQLKAKEEELAARDKELTELKAEQAEQAETAGKRHGVEALGSGAGKGSAASFDGDAAAAWHAAVAEKIAAGMRRPAAVKAVAHEQPELREAYVAEHNALHPQTTRR